jgi:PadR family transcriptional regulator, regulatory protein PadR
MAPRTPDLLPGTLDLLILRTLQKDPLHGWAISERIQQISDDVLQINQGSLYPALHRIEHSGLKPSGRSPSSGGGRNITG